MNEALKAMVRDIRPIPDEAIESAVQAHLDDLTKPQGSLGRLEEFVLQYCLCRGAADASIRRLGMYTFAGDHGITRQGVAPYPPEVTRQMVINMAAGGAAICVLCRNAGVDYSVVDVGVKGELSDHPRIIKRNVTPGSEDFSRGPAMSPETCLRALGVGFNLAKECEYDLLGIGEMGIGNSSSASALYALLLGIADPSETVGAGTGAHDELLSRKKAVIGDAVRLHRDGWDGSPFDALCRVGGLEIAAMTGMILGGAVCRIPVVVDGFIASAAALVAMRLHEHVGDYLFFAHESSERFHADFIAAQGIKPILRLGMRLGEGTGGVLAMQLIMQAMNCYHEMATFSGAGVATLNEKS